LLGVNPKDAACGKRVKHPVERIPMEAAEGGTAFIPDTSARWARITALFENQALQPPKIKRVSTLAA